MNILKLSLIISQITLKSPTALMRHSSNFETFLDLCIKGAMKFYTVIYIINCKESTNVFYIA